VSRVLRYTKDGAHRDTVRRAFLRWRAKQGIPERCDNTACQFHTQPLVWNGTKLTLILDHENGNSGDNRAGNLRLLCPNCDSQLATKGGGNIGRIDKEEGGFAIVNKAANRRFYELPIEPDELQISGCEGGVHSSNDHRPVQKREARRSRRANPSAGKLQESRQRQPPLVANPDEVKGG
jgi:hypothetical protein